MPNGRIVATVLLAEPGVTLMLADTCNRVPGTIPQETVQSIFPILINSTSSAIDQLDTANSRSSRDATKNNHLHCTLYAVAPALHADESCLDLAENKKAPMP
ncbi:hypothetical protein WHR41_06304 [Cladosporium halotolerans]|uniref:Uncharacterized protein n=1 Tax=Cladosporium halotolerans TaxID=1052096 RepID=A0AB34KMX9_9PEZI